MHYTQQQAENLLEFFESNSHRQGEEGFLSHQHFRLMALPLNLTLFGFFIKTREISEWGVSDTQVRAPQQPAASGRRGWAVQEAQQDGENHNSCTGSRQGRGQPRQMAELRQHPWLVLHDKLSLGTATHNYTHPSQHSSLPGESLPTAPSEAQKEGCHTNALMGLPKNRA